MTIKARVLAGRLIVDEPTSLPEGTEVELLPLDPGDWLDEEDRKALHAALARSEADVQAGRVVDAAEVLKGLRPHPRRGDYGPPFGQPQGVLPVTVASLSTRPPPRNGAGVLTGWGPG